MGRFYQGCEGLSPAPLQRPAALLARRRASRRLTPRSPGFRPGGGRLGAERPTAAVRMVGDPGLGRRRSAESQYEHGGCGDDGQDRAHPRSRFPSSPGRGAAWRRHEECMDHARATFCKILECQEKARAAGRNSSPGSRATRRGSRGAELHGSPLQGEVPAGRAPALCALSGKPMDQDPASPGPARERARPRGGPFGQPARMVRHIAPRQASGASKHSFQATSHPGPALSVLSSLVEPRSPRRGK